MEEERMIEIDAGKFVSKASIHEAFRSALNEDYYQGHTLDALADVLTALDVPTQITVLRIDAARELLGPYVDRLTGALADSAARNRRLTVVFR